MAITFTTTTAGRSADYVKYIWEKPSKIWRAKESILLNFALAPFGNDFIKLQPGDYITINSGKYSKWFTGYITNAPSFEYLGRKGSQLVHGYKYQATSDDYLLNLKQIGIIPPFLNLTYGKIIKLLAAKLAPGKFDTTNVQDGPIVAVYQVQPEQKFLDVINDFVESGKFIFYAKDHKLYFIPQDGPDQIELDVTNTHFTPSRLDLKPASTPSINDVIVLGDPEPQTYVHEYFVGTGVDAEFPLVAPVFGVEDTVLLDEQFSGSLDTSKWEVFDTPADFLQIDSNFLNILGGEGGGTANVRVNTTSAIAMEGRYRVIQGEWDFLNSTANGSSLSAGIIGSFFSQTPNLLMNGCLYGLQVSKSGANINVKPILNGVVDNTQSFTVDTTKRYVIRTLVEFFKLNRVVNSYVYIDSTGNRVELTAPSTSDDVHWQTLITEINPSTGAITRQLEFFNLGTVNNTVERYAVYCPVISDNLHASVSNISISVPVNATLEVREQVQLSNLSFDQWTENDVPTDWTDYENIFMDAGYANSGKAGKIQAASGGGFVKQLVGDKLVAGEDYYVTLRSQKNTGATTGNLKIYLQSDSAPYTSTPITIAVSTLTDFYKSYEGTLVSNLPSVPNDLKFVVELESAPDGVSVWIDDIIIFGNWKTKLVGPNLIDALDGITPVATIIAGNQDNRNTITGTVQYNTGQHRLVFFKDSATMTSDIPPEYHLVRLSYRAAGTSIARIRDDASVSTQAIQWGDDGLRSVVRSDINPRPRSSADCELAAKAIVLSNSGNSYEGSYEQWSNYFVQEPIPGMLIKFINHPELPANYIREITEVTTSLESKNEHFNHRISFGNREDLKKLLEKITAPKGSFQTSRNQSTPTAIDIDDVGTIFVDDVKAPYLVGWDDDEIFINTGEAPGANCVFEVRYTDVGWGSGDGKNLLISTASQTITLPRTRRGRVVFIRRVNTSTGAISRYSACLHIAFPVPDTPQVEEPITVPGIETSVPPVKTTGGLFNGSLTASWSDPDENGNRRNKFHITYESPDPLLNFKGVSVYAEGTEGPRLLGKQEFLGTTPSSVAFDITAEGFSTGDIVTIKLVSYSDTLEGDIFGAPYRIVTIPALTTGPAGSEYADIVTAQTASVAYGFLEDGSQAYKFTGSFSEPADTRYAGCKILAKPATSSDYIEVADCPQGQTTFTTDLWAIQHQSEDFTLHFLSYDTSGRRNTIHATTPKSAVLTVTKQLGSAGQEYANKVLAMTCTVGYSFTESGDQKYRFQGTVSPPTTDPRYKGCVLVARTGNPTFTVQVGFGDGTVVLTSSINIFGPEFVGKQIQIASNTYTITQWINSITISVSSPIAGPIRNESATILLNEDIFFYDLPLVQTVFSSDEWSINHQSESFTIYAVSYDAAGRMNTIVPGVTPQASVTVVRQEGVTGSEVDNVAVTTFEGPLVQTSQLGETLWYLSGDIFTPFDPRYGGCSIRILNISDPLKSQEIAFVSKGDRGETLKFKTELLTPGLGTITIIFLSVDTNNRPNTYVNGVTPAVVVTAPIQGSTLNLGYTSPGSLQTSAFASSIRPVSLLNSNPALPNSLYPAGTIIYNTSESRLYKVNSAGNAWTFAINGGLDIVADSITGGQIQAGAISTSELFAGEILVGAGGGKPTRFRVNDSGGTMVAFIGDNGAGFVGAYAINLRVGPDINFPNISASAFGVSILNAPLTLNTGGIITTVNNTFDGIITYGIRINSGNRESIVSDGFIYCRQVGSANGIFLTNSSSAGNTFRITNSGGVDVFKLDATVNVTNFKITVRDQFGVQRDGYTGTVGFLNSLGFPQVMNFTNGIMTHVS